MRYRNHTKKNIQLFLRKTFLKEMIDDGKVFTVGSYRRDATFLADLNLIVLRKYYQEFISNFEKLAKESYTNPVRELNYSIREKDNGMANLTYTGLSKLIPGVKEDSLRITIKVAESYGELSYLMFMNTGTKAFLTAFKHFLEKKECKITEKGIFDNDGEKVSLTSDDEKAIFELAGFDYIPTHMREADSIADGLIILREFIKE